MNKNFNIAVAKMRSLMERVDKHHTNYQATLNEDYHINEAMKPSRMEYNDIDELLWEKDFQAAKFVGLGYVIDATPFKTVYPTADNEAGLDDVIANNTEGGEWVEKLRGIRTGDKWNKIMSGKSKSAGFRDSINIIAVAQYTIKWQDDKKFGNWYNDRLRGEDELMNKWNVNPMDVMQQKEDNKEKMSHFIQYNNKYRDGQPIFYGTKDGETARYSNGEAKKVLKHVATFIQHTGTEYFYQSEDGSLKPVPKDAVNFLAYKLGVNPSKQDITKEVEDEAASFESELKAYRNDTSKLIKQFSLRQIGYIAATIKNKETGEKKSVAYVNPNVDPSEQSKPFSVNGKALYAELRRMANVEVQETKQEAEMET